MDSKTFEQVHTCQICDALAPNFDTVSFEIRRPSLLEQNGLLPEEIIETLLAILKHVYTGDDTVQIQKYNAHLESGLQMGYIAEYHIDATMPPHMISAASSKLDSLAPAFDEQEDTSPTPSFASIAKRMVLFTHTAAEFDSSTIAFDHAFQGQSFCCTSSNENFVRILLHQLPTQYYHDVISHLADTLEHTAKSILQNWNSPIGTLTMLGPLNYASIVKSIQPSVERTEHCIHDIIVHQAMQQPDSTAVDAWDGSFTYAEVYENAVQMARKLIRNGVRLEDPVPICMNKSRWAPIAMFGVMLAGATCIPFDIRAPRQRIDGLIEKMSARTIISDTSNLDKFEGFSLQIIIYPAEETDNDRTPVELPTVDPSSAAFVYFTSGSTGIPKGVVDEHRDFYVNIQALVKAFSLDRHSRVFQYASYVFDVSTGDTFAVFMAGDVLCIPSEEQKLSEPSAALESLRATHACLTNTIVSQISPSDVPSLRYLFVAGEALDKAQFMRWKDFVSFNVAYGTTETIVVDSLTTSSELLLDPKSLGRTTIGTCMWIVNPDDSEQLRPVGAFGEILIEGPAIGRGYMGETELTAQKFIDAPGWLELLRPNENIRAYRTGDMGFYNSNSSITFAGRADTQVKLRGQRVELLEIESSIRIVLTLSDHVVVEIVKFSSPGDTETLVACLADSTNAHLGESPLPLTPARRAQCLQIQHDLIKLLPQYMIPPLFIPFNKFPRTVTGKLDRKSLRQLIASVSSDDLGQYYLTSSPVHQPETEAQKWLQPVWAAVLNVPEDSIDIEDQFFQAGGDSFKAMQLIASLRERHIQISADTIFRQPVFDDIATALTVDTPDVNASERTPFQMTRTIADTELCIQQVANACGVEKGSVVDIYPASPIQEALIATSATRPYLYRQQHVLELPASIDLDRFKWSIEAVISVESILRTRIVYIQNMGALQAVLRNNSITWDTESTMKQRMACDWSHTMTFGDSLCYFSIVQESHQRCLIWTAHHSIYNAWSRDLIYVTCGRRS